MTATTTATKMLWDLESDDERRCGTLADWAKDFETGHLSGDFRPSNDVLTLDGPAKVEVTFEGTDEADWMFYTVRLGDEEVTVRLDGRV